MAKGGRYLNKKKPEKKKGKAGKVILIIVLVLALLVGGALFAANKYLDSLLGNVTQAEFEEKNQDKSYEDLMAEMYGSMDGVETRPTGTAAEPEGSTAGEAIQLETAG